MENPRLIDNFIYSFNATLPMNIVIVLIAGIVYFLPMKHRAVAAWLIAYVLIFTIFTSGLIMMFMEGAGWNKPQDGAWLYLFQLPCFFVSLFTLWVGISRLEKEVSSARKYINFGILSTLIVALLGLIRSSMHWGIADGMNMSDLKSFITVSLFSLVFFLKVKNLSNTNSHRPGSRAGV